MSKVNSSYQQFMIRKMHAIRKRKEAQVLNRFERAVPKLQGVIAEAAKTSKWINLVDMQRAYHV